MDDPPRRTHQLRGHLATIGISAATLELEPDLSKTGRTVVKRIHEALVLAEREIEEIGKAFTVFITN